MPENRDIERRKPDEIERRRDSLVQRSVDYLKEFEEQGLANVEEPDLAGWDLYGAAKEDRADIARALIARGDNVNAREKRIIPGWHSMLFEEGYTNPRDDWTPIHEASYWNSLEVARLLIENGAEVNTRGHFYAPLHVAAFNNSHETAQLLIKNGAVVDALKMDHDDYIGLDPDDPLPSTPLHVAAAENSLAVARLLIEHGADTGRMDLSWMK